MDGKKFEHDPSSRKVRGSNSLKDFGSHAVNDFLNGLPYSDSSIELMAAVVADCHEIDIRDEQLECLDAIYRARDEGTERALVQMATGLGKTTVIAADVRRFLQEHPESRVLFLCHQNDILLQARERFERVIGGDFTYGNFTGEDQDFHGVTCLFASFQAMRNWRDAFLEDEFDYVVVDESHHSKASTYEPTLNYFKPKFMLGVTATPDRHDMQDIREIFGDEIYRLSLEEAIARGLLAEVDYRVMTEDIDMAALRSLLKNKARSVKQIDRSIFIPKRDEEIVRIINEKALEFTEPKQIIFCRSIEQAEELAQYFEHGVPLHSKLPKWQQDQAIANFRGSGAATLLTIDMFNEGIDIPDANQVIFLRSTQSRTVFLQQLGRGLRKTTNKSSVQILDFVANCDRLIMLEVVWRNIQEASSFFGGRHMQPLDVVRIDFGSFSFSQVARDILEILSDIEADNIYRAMPRDDAIVYFKKVVEEFGFDNVNSSLISHLYYDGRGPSYSTLTHHFSGKITELRKAAGFEVPDRFVYTEGQCVDIMLKVIEERGGKRPTAPEFSRMKLVPQKLYIEYFGSYLDYVKAANREWVKRRRGQSTQHTI